MKVPVFLFALALSLPLHAGRILNVHPETGNNGNDGVTAPVKSIARAVALAQPGDTVLLAPVTYYESVNLGSKAGLPDQPIIIDGQGATIEGSAPVKAADWESLGGGLFRKVNLVSTAGGSYVGRWFFLWDGRMNHMGRTSKGPSQPLKKVADLQAGEWTYVLEENAHYLKIPEGQTLDAANIRYPALANGVSLSRKGAHLIIRNITATHVYNDGFNIHGDQVGIVFENITAIECGDDGFSAHETAECRVDGFRSIGNSTGLCDIGSSVTHFKNVFIQGCLGHDVFFIGDTEHSMENVLIESSAAYCITVGQPAVQDSKGPCRASFKNVLVRRQEGLPGSLRVSAGCRVETEACTFVGLDVDVMTGGDLLMKNCAVSAKETAKSNGANAASLQSLTPPVATR